MASIFLSHAHEDKEFARKLAASLRHEGHVVWIDEAEINIGDSLVEKIREGIDAVDYVAAILSESSIDSGWARKELDLASNRELDEDRVFVLPILLEQVELPGFLKGKFYGDFTNPGEYEEKLGLLLRKLGPTEKPPQVENEELNQLRAELQVAKQQITAHTRDVARRNALVSKSWSPNLREAVEKANKQFPSHKIVNDAYAFESGSTAITLDYLLWGLAKARMRGSHILDVVFSMNDSWPEAQAMLEAYIDLVGDEEG